jgi:hypothetical protein
MLDATTIGSLEAQLQAMSPARFDIPTFLDLGA